MGLDLTLLPLEHKTAEIARTQIQCDRDYDLFNKIHDLENKRGVDIPRQGISTYRSEGYGIVETTKYGERMKSVLAGELAAVFAESQLESWRNKAVASYLRQLPKNLPIYLYWK